MFDTKPIVTEQQLYSEPKIDTANPAGFGEVFDSSLKELRSTSQVTGELFRESSVYDEHIKRVTEALGKADPRLENPIALSNGYGMLPVYRKTEEFNQRFTKAFDSYKAEGGTASEDDFFSTQYARRDFLARLKEIADENPDKRSIILPERDLSDSARGMWRDSKLKAEETWQRSNKDFSAWVAYSAAQLYGGITDVPNLAAMALTPEIAAGRGFLGLARAAATAGAYNAALEVGVQPFIRAQATDAGGHISLAESAISVGSAFGIGFGLDAGVRGAFRGVQTYRGLTPILKDDHIIGWKRTGDAPDPATVAAPGSMIESTPLDISPELTARAFGEGSDAVAARAEIAKRIESAPDHVSMETVIKAESGDVAAQRKVAEVTGEIERPDVRGRIEAEETANATLRNRPSELVDDDTHLAAIKQSLAYVADPQGTLPPARVLESGPATGWLRDLRAKVDELQARVQNELTDEDRKALLVVNTFDRANADPVAAARMLREEPALMTRDLDFGETGLSQARSIATLSDEAFERVASGEYAPEIGALVADHVPEGFQIRALQDLTDRAPTSEAAARAMLADMLNSPDYRPPSLDAETPVTLRERQMDDPYGKEAQAQVQQLENDLAEELGRKAAPDPTPVKVITDAIKKADEVRAAIESVSGMLPEGVRVKTYTALSDVPETVVADMLAANRQRFERASLAYQIADNAEARALARLELDEALALRGVEAFVDTADANTIWLASYAMNPRGRIAHEAVHILKAQGRIAPDELTALAQYARESGAFSPTRQASYAEAYKARGTPERIAELLDEEAVSHLIEARANGKLDPVDIPPRVLTVLDRIAEFFDSIRNALVGKGFKSTAETTFAARKAQAAEIERLISTIMDGEAAKRVATQAVMQAEDIKAMAVKPVAPAVADDIPFELPRYADPEGNELSFDDARAVVDMWRYVRNQKKQTQPQSLIPFLIEAGRLMDQDGEISNLLGGQGRYLISGAGKNLDEAGRLAWEAGFIPTNERPTVAEFIDYVRQEIGGERVYKSADSERVTDLQWAKQAMQDLDRMGVADAKTEREVMQRLEVGGGDRTRFALADLAKRNDAVLLDDMGPNDPHPGRVLALHGTRANFDAFDPAKSKDFGVHFGTQPQSDVFAGLISSREQARVLPVVIDAKTVVDVPDLMMWPANDVAQAVEAKVPAAQGLADEVAAAPGDAGKDALRKGLTARGIDALRYWNESEGDGWSYIVWDKGHVTSATSPKDAMIAGKPQAEAVKPKSDGTMFAFAGERAKTADLEALARAKKMTDEGKDRTEIWTSTGWFRGVDGKWRFEIDDKNFKLTPDTTSSNLTSGPFEHPGLSQAYPDTSSKKFRHILLDPAEYENARVAGGATTNDGINMVSTPDAPQASSVALHELQHFTQRQEGFSIGGAPDLFRFGGEMRPFKRRFETPDGAYRRLAGETEARTVQKRMDMTAEERRARPPWLDYDVPEDQQIVRFGAGQQHSETLFAMRDADTGQSMRRDIDALGYYSAALEAAKGLKQAKGTPEQMLAQLKSAGVKQAEIDATNIPAFLDGKTSVTRDEIAAHLEQNRVGMKEVNYGRALEYKQLEDIFLRGTPDQQNQAMASRRDLMASGKIAKWSSHSLDPSNPTYRETVLHLPAPGERPMMTGTELPVAVPHPSTSGKWSLRQSDGSYYAQSDRYPFSSREEAEIALSTAPTSKYADKNAFYNGHFPEPNIIGHMMTSMTKHEGKPVYTIDQIQSDWGQKLRDGGVRDEAKIAELQTQYYEALKKSRAGKAAYDQHMRDRPGNVSSEDWLRQMPEEIYDKPHSDATRLGAELRTAEASASGHPLVNTTDQWTTTTLRRAIRQASEADAEYIAIPSGETVLSYNPGDTHGMQEFYGKIVPKNLRNILAKLDKDSPAPQRIETLDTPTRGAKGNGFTIFPLTEKVKASVREEGQAIFAMRDERGREKLGAAERAAQLKDDLAAIETRFQASGGDEREKLQAKRAVLLNAQKQEKRLDEIEQYRSFAGTFDSRKVADPARAFLLQHEAYGSISDTPFMDLKHLKEVIEKDAMSRMADVAYEYRKGAITGDMRRRGMRTSIDNMMKEAAGENTGDALAKKLAHSWLSTAEYLRQRFNAAGGDIGKLEGWIAPQHHDAEMLMQVGQRKWVDYLMGKGVLDRERMLDLATGKPFEDAALRDVLGDIWMTITTSGKNNLDPDNPVMGRGAMYKRHMDNRVIHFKDAESWLKYQREMGSGDVVAEMYGHVSRMARDIAAMEVYGANPALTRDRIKATLRKQAAEYRPGGIAMAEFDEVMAAAWQKLTAANRKALDDAGIMQDVKTFKELFEREAVNDQPESPALMAKKDAAYKKMEANLAEFEKVMGEAFSVKTRALISEIRNEAETPSVLAKKKNPQSYTDKMLTRADEVWDAFMGTSNVPADYVIAQRAAATRNWISSSALVYTPFASLSDFSTQLGARRFIGMPVTSQLSSYFKAFKGSSKEEMIRAGLGHEVAMTAFQEQAMSVNRFNAHQVSGFIADRSHTFSFLSPMTAAQKTGFSHDFMTWMPTLQKLPYNELPAEVQRMFKRHGVSVMDWARLRKVEPEMLGGSTPALTRNAIQDQFGIDLADKYVMMLLRERAFSTIESGFRARSLITSNSKAGTLLGEIARSGGMFKAFPTMYTMLIIGRQYSEIMNGRYGSFAAYTSAATIGGMLLAAVAIQTKHILQGRDPEDMRKPSFFVRSFMQAGGGGIFGDFINSATDRNQNSVGETLLGPMFGMAQKGLNLTLGNAGQYGRDEKSNAGREALKIVRGMTPGAFVPWYLRMAYNRMILDEMQKVVDPDAHKAFQSQRRNTKKLTGNDYFWGPGETYPNRGPRIGAQ